MEWFFAQHAAEAPIPLLGSKPSVVRSDTESVKWAKRWPYLNGSSLPYVYEKTVIQRNRKATDQQDLPRYPDGVIATIDPGRNWLREPITNKFCLVGARPALMRRMEKTYYGKTVTVEAIEYPRDMGTTVLFPRYDQATDVTFPPLCRNVYANQGFWSGLYEVICPINNAAGWTKPPDAGINKVSIG